MQGIVLPSDKSLLASRTMFGRSPRSDAIAVAAVDRSEETVGVALMAFVDPFEGPSRHGLTGLYDQVFDVRNSRWDRTPHTAYASRRLA